MTNSPATLTAIAYAAHQTRDRELERRHEEYMEWAGDFVPDRFDANKATKAMRRGLPDWRE